MRETEKQVIEKYSAIVVGIFLVFILIRLSAYVGAWICGDIETSKDQMVAWIVGEIFVLAMVGLLIGLSRNLSWREMLAVRDKSWYWRGVLSGVLLFGFMLLGSMVLAFFVREIEPQAVVNEIVQAKDWKLILGYFLFSTILAPFTEELLCRGYLYGILERYMAGKAAICLTALVFAVLHFDLYRFLLLFVAGVWLNLVYTHSRSVVISAITHGVFNGCMLLMVIVL